MSSHRMLLMLLVAVVAYMVIFKRSEKLRSPVAGILYDKSTTQAIGGNKCPSGYKYNLFKCFKNCERGEQDRIVKCFKCPASNPIPSGDKCYKR